MRKCWSSHNILALFIQTLSVKMVVPTLNLECKRAFLEQCLRIIRQRSPVSKFIKFLVSFNMINMINMIAMIDMIDTIDTTSFNFLFRSYPDASWSVLLLSPSVFTALFSIMPLITNWCSPFRWESLITLVRNIAYRNHWNLLICRLTKPPR